MVKYLEGENEKQTKDRQEKLDKKVAPPPLEEVEVVEEEEVSEERVSADVSFFFFFFFFFLVDNHYLPPPPPPFPFKTEPRRGVSEEAGEKTRGPEKEAARNGKEPAYRPTPTHAR